MDNPNAISNPQKFGTTGTKPPKGRVSVYADPQVDFRHGFVKKEVATAVDRSIGKALHNRESLGHYARDHMHKNDHAITTENKVT